MKCNNCGTRIKECDKQGCRKEFKAGDQIICYEMPGTAGKIHKHFCSMAHMNDWIWETTKPKAIITNAEEDDFKERMQRIMEIRKNTWR